MASRSTQKGKGRQKTKMEKMENESNLQVTFSKRRYGLFKKAFELSIMTEAELAIIVNSPGGKVYSFAHPSPEVVTHKLLTGNPQPKSYMQQLVQDQRDKHVTEKITELKTIKNNLEAEIKRGKDLDRTLAQSQNQYWGAPNKKDCDKLPQLKLFVAALKNLKANVKKEIGARALVELKNYGVPAGIDSSLHKRMQLPLVGPNYSGVGRENGLPTLIRERNLYQVSEGSGYVSGGVEGSGGCLFTNGRNSFSGHGLPPYPALNVNERNEGVTGSGGVYISGGNRSMNNGPGSFTSCGLLPSSGLNIYEGNKGVTGSGGVYIAGGNRSLNYGPGSSTSLGLPALPGLNAYEDGEGSGNSEGTVNRGSYGNSIHNGHGFFSRRYWPYTRSRLNVNESGQFNSGTGGNFHGAASGRLFNAGAGHGLPSTNGSSSFGVADNDGGSIDGVPELDASMPSHGFGVDFRYL